MTDIITLGELLIDMTQSGSDELGNGCFTAYPGGAPANVAVAAARLGAKTAFVGKVGDDAFGRCLKSVLEREGVDVSGLYTAKRVPTTMAIVSVDEEGEREFSFYRDPGADTQLTTEEAIAAIKHSIGRADGEDDTDKPGILHVGSLSMTTSPSREATEAAVNYARENGILVSYDPNYRGALWESEETAIDMMKRLLPLADILKVSDEEMVMLTGTDDCEEGSRLLSEYGPGLVMVTLGPEGVLVRRGSSAAVVKGFSVKVADTNGAGDTFLGAMLSRISGRQDTADGASGGEAGADILSGISEEELLSYVTYANKAASLTCSRHGAIPAMPTADEVII